MHLAYPAANMSRSTETIHVWFLEVTPFAIINDKKHYQPPKTVMICSSGKDELEAKRNLYALMREHSRYKELYFVIPTNGDPVYLNTSTHIIPTNGNPAYAAEIPTDIVRFDLSELMAYKMFGQQAGYFSQPQWAPLQSDLDNQALKQKKLQEHEAAQQAAVAAQQAAVATQQAAVAAQQPQFSVKQQPLLYKLPPQVVSATQVRSRNPSPASVGYPMSYASVSAYQPHMGTMATMTHMVQVSPSLTGYGYVVTPFPGYYQLNANATPFSF